MFSMRRIRTTLLALVAIPALLGFQVVSDQLMLCDFGAREIIICEINPQTSEWFCMVMPCEPEMMIREEFQLVLRACLDAPSSAAPVRSTDIGCVGTMDDADAVDLCCDLDDAEPLPCASVMPCENQTSNPCDDTESPIPDCPMGAVRCCACIPGRLLVLPADAAVSRLTLAKIYPSESATLDLRLADLQRVDRHAHSPPKPPPVLASGYEICLDKCSLLL